MAGARAEKTTELIVSSAEPGGRPRTAAGKTPIIPSKADRRSPRDYDRHLYREERHLIENLFAKLQQFRAIATRYDKTARNFFAAVYLAASTVWLN